jgi:dCMP deaminase
MTGPRQPRAKHAVYMSMAFALAERSKDPATQHGAIIVDQHGVIVSQGYNGPPRKIADHRVNWARPDKYPYMMHAEENAIRFATAARGIYGLRDCTLYVTGQPCSKCMLRIVAAEIETVYYGPRTWGTDNGADWQLATEIAELGGVKVYLSLEGANDGTDGEPV